MLFDGNSPDYVSSQCYLGVHLDRTLSWKVHITPVRVKSSWKLIKLDWLFLSSKLDMATKALLIKDILGRTLTYAIQVWETASKTQLNRLRVIQYNVSNQVIERDFKVVPLGDQINFHSSRYANRLSAHSNTLANDLVDPISLRRLKRIHPHESLHGTFVCIIIKEQIL